MNSIPRIYLLLAVILFFGCEEFKSSKEPATNNQTSTETPKETSRLDNEFLINGTSFNDQLKTVYLHKTVNKIPEIIDSVTVENKSFVFKGIIENPAMYSVSGNTSNKRYHFLIDNSSIDLFLNETIENSSTYSTSTIQKDYRIYTSKINEFKSKGVALYYNLKGNFSSESINQLKKDRAKLFGDQSKFTLDFITKHPDSYFSALLIKNNIDVYSVDKLSELYNGLSSDLKQNIYVSNIDSIIAEKKAFVAEPIPVAKTTISIATNTTSSGEYRPNAYSLSGLNQYGQTMSLNSIPRGKVVLLDFWASWCAPCRATNPDLVGLYNKYNEDGFEIMSVSEDRNEADWMNAIAIDNLSWDYHVLDKNKAIAFRYGVEAIPYKILIDKQGRIASGKISGRNLEQRIKELLHE